MKVLARKISQSHAHAAKKHQIYVRDAVSKLFKATPNDARLCVVKEELFGIAGSRGPIIGSDHPVMVDMMALPIIGEYFHIIINASFYS